MAKQKYKRVIKRVLRNKSNDQLMVALPNGCGIEAGKFVKIVPFRKKDFSEEIIKKTMVNKINNQIMVTVPKNSGISYDELVEIVPLALRPVNMEKYPIYERSDVYQDDDGEIMIKPKEDKE